MDQTLADALELPKGLNRLRALTEDAEMFFAYAPEDAILLLDHKMKLNKGKLVTALRAAGVEDGALTATVWCGTVGWKDAHAVFRVNPKYSSGGPLQVKTMRKGLLSLSRDLRGCIALRDAEILRPGDKVGTSDDLRESGGSTTWVARFGKGSPYTKILDELDDLQKDRTNDKRREGLSTLMKRIDQWFVSHDEDIGEGGDKQLRAEALIALRDQVVGELARTLEEGRAEPTEEERAIVLAALEEQAMRAAESEDPEALALAARNMERWAGLEVRPDRALTTEVATRLGESLRQSPGRATPRAVKAASRFVRRVRLDMLEAPTELARLALIDGQMTALESLQQALSGVLDFPGQGPEWARTLESAAEEAVKLERDLAAIHKARTLQVAILQDEEAIRFSGDTGSVGASGSYFVSDGERPRAVVFKPVSQEVVPDDQGWPPGIPARGEVLGARFGELLGQKLGVNFGVPPTDIGILQSGIFERYRPAWGIDANRARQHSQLGVVQDFVGVSHGNLNDHYVFHSEELGIDVPIEGFDDAKLMEALGKALEGHPDIHWEELTQDERRAISARVCNRRNQILRYPEEMNLDEFGRGLDQIAILDLFTLQTDRNPGNVLLDIREGEDGQMHTHTIPIDQALSMPSLTAGCRSFSGGAHVAGANGFSAWIEAPGSDRPLDGQLIEALVQLDIDSQIDDLRLESEQLDESTGGRLPALPNESLEVQRLSMRAVQEALRGPRALSRRQLANLITDFDRIPWSPGPPPQKSPFGEALRRLEAVKRVMAEARADEEGLDGGARDDRVEELMEADLLSRGDFDAEWNEGLRPSIAVWLDALPAPQE